VYHRLPYAPLTVPASKAISVRLDDRSSAALRALADTGMSPSEAIRHALVEAARTQQLRSSLAAEVARLAADEEDRREKARITEDMDEISDPW